MRTTVTACILSLLGRRGIAFDWLERSVSVSSGFACWPFLSSKTEQGLTEALPSLLGALQTYAYGVKAVGVN
jgi:hypothetical protein